MSDPEDGRKRYLSGEGGGSSSNQQANKLLKGDPISAPNPNVNPVVIVNYPGSNSDIPWRHLLRPLSLINAVHLESVSLQFQASVFAGQHRLVWNFKYRSFIFTIQRLNSVQARNKALVFLLTKIRLFCRQLIIKELEHPDSPLDQEIFANLPILESVYLKYGKPEGINNRALFNVLNNSFHTFLENAQTMLSALEKTNKAEIRIHCDPRRCPKSLSKPTKQVNLIRALKAFGGFLAERRESLISLQLAPFEKYYTREAQVVPLNLKALTRLRKLRVVFQREKPTNFSQGTQYKDGLTAVIEHLDTLYIKWGEVGHLNLHQIVTKRENTFLHPLWPIWCNRIDRNATPILLRALAIDFNWVNVSFEDESLHRAWFNQSWKTLGEMLSYALSKERFKKLSLTLPTSPNHQDQGCFYFSDAFIQEFVQNRSLDYLRLVFSKAMPGVALKFGLAELATLEISFSCLKGKTFSNSTNPAILFDLDSDYWRDSLFAVSVRSLKLKYAPYFDAALAKHLARAFPYLAKFSFTAFHREVYNQVNFLRGLRMLLERIYSLRVIRLGDSFDKSHLDLADFLRDLQARANNDTCNKFVFYASKATLDERSQAILDNSRLVGSNFRITVETFPRIQVQDEMHRELPEIMQFPNEGLQSLPSLPVNRPEYAPVGTSQRTSPQLFPPLPSSTVTSSRPLSQEDLSGSNDFSLAPSGSISQQTFSRAPNVQPFANVPGTQPTYQFQEFMQQQPQFPNERLPNAPMHLSQNVFTYQQTPSQQFLNRPSPVVPSSRAPSPRGLLSSINHWQLPQSSSESSNIHPGGYIPHQNLNWPQNVHPAANFPGNQPAYSFPAQQAANQHQLQNAPRHLSENAPGFTYQQTPLQALPQQFPIQTSQAVASRLTPLPGRLPQNELNVSTGFHNWPQSSQGNSTIHPSGYMPHQNLNLPPNVQPAPNIPGNQPASPLPVQQAANQGQPPADEIDFAMFMAEIDKESKK